jgi:hypothetical protein
MFYLNNGVMGKWGKFIYPFNIIKMVKNILYGFTKGGEKKNIQKKFI